MEFIEKCPEEKKIAREIMVSFEAIQLSNMVMYAIQGKQRSGLTT